MFEICFQVDFLFFPLDAKFLFLCQILAQNLFYAAFRDRTETKLRLRAETALRAQSLSPDYAETELRLRAETRGKKLTEKSREI